MIVKDSNWRHAVVWNVPNHPHHPMNPPLQSRLKMSALSKIGSSKLTSRHPLTPVHTNPYPSCLPLMYPLRIHVKPDAEPVAIHKPSTIPAHWLSQVRQEIEQDIALNVLERVPSNMPTTWCSHMHVVSKKTGQPLMLNS